MKIKIWDIKWDTDGEEVDLPTQVVREVGADFCTNQDTTDLLSDEFGFCVFDCKVKVVEK